MRLKRHMFGLAVLGAGIFVALTFYLGHRNAERLSHDLANNTNGYVDSLYRRPPVQAAETVASASRQRTATISVTTEPPGARVVIESDTVGRSPVEGYRTRPGVLFLSLSKSNYVPVDTITITKENTHTHASFSLRPTGEGLAADSSRSERPASASTNDTPDSAPSSNRGSESRSSSQEAAGSESTQTNASPSPQAAQETTGELRATSTPTEASVWVDGRRAGTTPTTLSGLEPGNHRVSFVKTGYEAYHTAINVEGGSTETVDATLRRVTGTLSVLVKPWGSIYIDGELHKSDTDLQYTTQLPAGEHRLRLVHPSLGIWENSVEVPAGATQETVIDLTEVPTRQPE